MSALRRQLLPLLLIEVVIDSIVKNTENPTPELGVCIGAVRKALDGCHAPLAVYNVGRLNVDPHLVAMQNVVKECWIGREDQNVTGEMVNACMLLAADVTAQAPPSKKHLWGKLEISLQALYELLDPDLVDIEAIEGGSRVGEKFKEVLW